MNVIKSNDEVVVKLSMLEAYVLMDYIRYHGVNFDVELPKHLFNELKEIIDEVI